MAAEQDAIAGLLAEGAVEVQEEALQSAQTRHPSRVVRIARGALLVTLGVVAGACGTLLVARDAPSSGSVGSRHVGDAMSKVVVAPARSLTRGAGALRGELSGKEKRALLRAGGDTHACDWVVMKQHDFPERSDVESMKLEHFKSVHEVKRFAEKFNYVGFAVHNDTAFLKGGDNAPRSWKDLVWMGNQFKVDFYLCEKLEVYKQTQEAVDQAMKLVNGYITRKTAAVKDQWVTVHALPKDEGASMGFDNGHDCTDIADFKVLCAAHPDCVGFAHNPQTKKFFAKKKWSGFDARRSKYYKKGHEGWEWHYIQSRGEVPAVEAPLWQEDRYSASPEYHSLPMGAMFRKK